MPKQVRYSKDCIVNASIEILRSQGPDALTARAIGKCMGCSVAPLFRTFSNMDELMESVRERAEDILRTYIAESVNYRPAFKAFGLRLIRFSREEANLFHFLFLEKGARSDAADKVARECLKQTAADFSLTEEQTEYLYEHTWPYSCGLAQLSSKNPEKYSEEAVSELLSSQFTALMMLIKSGREVVDIEPKLI